MKIHLELPLVWESPIRHLLPEDIEFDSTRCLTFCATKEFDAIPPVGCDLFFCIPESHAMHEEDEIDAKVSCVFWLERKATFSIDLSDVEMGEPPGTTEEMMGHIEWVESHGFTWIERKTQAVEDAT